MKKLMFLFLSLFLVFTSSNAFGATYSLSTFPAMTDEVFQRWAENLITDSSNIDSIKAVCSPLEYNISSTIEDSDKIKIKKCWEKIAYKINSINNLAIANTNFYRKQTRNDYLVNSLKIRNDNFLKIKAIPWYEGLTDKYLPLNFKPLLKPGYDNYAYWKYQSLINWNSSTTWSFSNINLKLENFNNKMMTLYDTLAFSWELNTSNSNTKYWIQDLLDIEKISTWAKLIDEKNAILNSLDELNTNLINYNAGGILFNSNYADYYAFLKWAISDSLDTQINELNTALRYKFLSKEIYPSNDALMFLVKQLYSIQLNVNQNQTIGNRNLIMQYIKEWLLSWLLKTKYVYYPNTQKLFPISTSTYEITPNLADNKKSTLRSFVNNIVYGKSTSTASAQKNEFLFPKITLNKLSTYDSNNPVWNLIITNWIISTSANGTHLSMEESYKYIKAISKTFTKWKIYTVNDVVWDSN